MFVSHRYQFVFLEIPRTGTHSITQALYEMDPQSPTLEKRIEVDP